MAGEVREKDRTKWTSEQKKQYKEEDAAAKKKSDGEYSELMGDMALGTATTLTNAQQVGLAAYQASVNAATNAAMAAIAQQAAIAAAALKLSNDLNDATVSFTKNIGSSVKSAAQ